MMIVTGSQRDRRDPVECSNEHHHEELVMTITTSSRLVTTSSGRTVGLGGGAAEAATEGSSEARHGIVEGRWVAGPRAGIA